MFDRIDYWRWFAHCAFVVLIGLFVFGSTLTSVGASRAARNLLAQGNVEYRQLHYQKSLAKYDEAIKEDGSYGVAHNNRGLALHKLGKLEDAEAAILKAIQSDSNRAAYHLNLGKVYASAARYDEALAELDRALEIKPALAEAVYNKAWVLEAKGDFVPATRMWADLGVDKNAPPGTKLLRGALLLRQGQVVSLVWTTYDIGDLPQQWRWLSDINRCLATGGAADMTDEARSSLREALRALSTEQLQEARTKLAATMTMVNGSPLPHWLTAMAWIVEGNHEQATPAMEQARRLMPTFHIPADKQPHVLFVDGVHAGCAPLSLPVLPGMHTIRVIRGGQDGPESLTQNYSFASGGNYRFDSQTEQFVSIYPSDDLSLPSDLDAAIRNLVQTELTRPAILRTDFEFELGPWTATSRDGKTVWHIVGSRAADGKRCARAGVPGKEDYSGNADTMLTSAPFSLLGLSGRPWLRFKHSPVGDATGDILRVEVSTADSEEWHEIDSSANERLGPDWQELTIDLSRWRSAETRLRFHFASDHVDSGQGVYLDSIRVEEETVEAWERISRVFTDSTGRFQVRAILVTYDPLDAKSDVVILQKQDGSIVNLPSMRLSSEDRRWLIRDEWDRLSRGWSSVSGEYNVQAIFLGQDPVDNGIVILRKEDGVVIRVPSEKLSVNDRNWLQSEETREK